MNAATEANTTVDTLRDTQQRLERQERRLALILMSGTKGIARDPATVELNASIEELRDTISTITASSEDAQ